MDHVHKIAYHYYTFTWLFLYIFFNLWVGQVCNICYAMMLLAFLFFFFFHIKALLWIWASGPKSLCYAQANHAHLSTPIWVKGEIQNFKINIYICIYILTYKVVYVEIISIRDYTYFNFMGTSLSCTRQLVIVFGKTHTLTKFIA